MSSISSVINNYCLKVPSVIIKSAECAVFGVGIVTLIIPSIFVSLAAVPLNMIVQPTIFMKKWMISNEIKFIKANYKENMKKIVSEYLLQQDGGCGGWENKTVEDKIALIRAFSLFGLIAINEEKKNLLQSRSRVWVVRMVPILNAKTFIFKKDPIESSHKEDQSHAYSSTIQGVHDEICHRFDKAKTFFYYRILTEKELDNNNEAKKAQDALFDIYSMFLDMHLLISEPLKKRTMLWLFNTKNI